MSKLPMAIMLVAALGLAACANPNRFGANGAGANDASRNGGGVSSGVIPGSVDDPTSMAYFNQRVGDRVLPSEAQPYDLQFLPRAPDVVPANARIMAVADGMQAAPDLVVAISVGARDGIRNGHVMSIWNEGSVVPDTVAHRSQMAAKADKVQLPDEFVGNLMVFRTFDKVAYALVMNGIRPVQQGDVLKHPDATE